jgi:imidazole glycerol-phosphate synthase subunit HisH
MITIVDYTMGNPASIRNMLKKLGHASTITNDPAEIITAKKLILPGVGAFDAGMSNLARFGLVEPLGEAVLKRGTPVLGICLGMQLMTRRSDEGEKPGLGWVAADTVKFDRTSNPQLRVPHMGWNLVTAQQPSVLTTSLQAGSRFYFVHGYYVACDNPQDVSLDCDYGKRFHAAFSVGNIHGVQFHPEKSHKFGMALLQNYAEKVH